MVSLTEGPVTELTVPWEDAVGEAYEHTKLKYSDTLKNTSAPCGGWMRGFCGHVNHQAAEKDGSASTGLMTGYHVTGRGQ